MGGAINELGTDHGGQARAFRRLWETNSVSDCEDDEKPDSGEGQGGPVA